MRLPKIALVLIPVALLAAACSSTSAVTQSDVESEIANAYATAASASVDDITVSCPGDLEGTVGTKMTCDVTVGDVADTAIVTVTSVTDDKVLFDLESGSTDPSVTPSPSAS